MPRLPAKPGQAGSQPVLAPEAGMKASNSPKKPFPPKLHQCRLPAE
ncbi:MAG: hypothetical protein ABSA05_03655 [Opitutaceae bacterium]